MHNQVTEPNLQTLAERICAAFISAQMGFASVDYVIKRYVRAIGEPPAPLWFEIAAFVSDVMTQVRPLPVNLQAQTPESDAALPQTVVRKRRPKNSGSKKKAEVEN
jgi:hypothetical protein